MVTCVVNVVVVVAYVVVAVMVRFQGLCGGDNDGAVSGLVWWWWWQC
jgi:hypothetical protein